MRPKAAAAARIASVIMTGSSSAVASGSVLAAIVCMTRTAACASSLRFLVRLLDPLWHPRIIGPLLSFCRIGGTVQTARRSTPQLDDVVEARVATASLDIHDVVPIEPGQRPKPRDRHGMTRMRKTRQSGVPAQHRHRHDPGIQGSGVPLGRRQA